MHEQLDHAGGDGRRRHVHRPGQIRRRSRVGPVAGDDCQGGDHSSGLRTRRPRGAAQGRRAAERDRLSRPRHDRRHQRSHRAQGGEGRTDHHRGVPRHAGDRPRQPARPVQPSLPQTAALRAALPAPRAAGPDELPRRGDAAARPVPTGGDRRGFPCRRRAGGGDLLPALLRQPGARTRRRSGGAAPLARGVRGVVAPHRARVARIRTYQHHGALRLRAAHGRALPASPERRPRRPGFRGQSLRHAVQRRHRLARGRGTDADHDDRIGTLLRRVGRRPTRRADWRPEHHCPRHRRHHGEVLAHRSGQHQDRDRLLDRARRQVGGLPGHGAGGRHGRDRQRRRFDSLGG